MKNRWKLLVIAVLVLAASATTWYLIDKKNRATNSPPANISLTTPAESDGRTPATDEQPTTDDQSAKVNTDNGAALSTTPVKFNRLTKPVSVAPPASIATSFSAERLQKENSSVKPSVAAYAVKPGLTNVVNLKLYKPLLAQPQLEKLAKNGFVVTPTNYTQMFEVYENNEYQRPKYAAFVTTDAMLHTYHVFYDYTLRQLESYKLYDNAVTLSGGMLAASQADYAAAKNPKVKEAALHNIGYFALARLLLTGAPPPKEVAGMVNTDADKIAKHQKKEESAIIGPKLDFTQFVPRGHYTRTEKLKKYFKAMMWYGKSVLPSDLVKYGERPTIESLLIVRDLRTIKIGKDSALDIWDRIYEPTVFYVGSADDYTARQYGKITDEIYGSNPSPDDFADTAKLKRFNVEVGKLPQPKIQNLDPEGFRFMGQRFIPDSRILQEMVDPKVLPNKNGNPRVYPSGLDIFSALGSERALNHLRTYYQVTEHPRYFEQMDKMRKEMKETPLSTWQSNLYYGWVWSLKPIIDPAPVGYPSFMRNDAWLDKSLLTALGSWTELRHDTILYAKQSEAECGGDDEEKIVTPKGYVEPNIEFWTRLYWLNEYTQKGLKNRGLLNEELTDKFTKLSDWLQFCRRISIKELENKKVTEAEYLQIEMYGAELEGLIKSFAGGDLLSDTDKDMALVADVHTGDSDVLEEATGRSGAIYVVVPIQGKLYLTRGAIYMQYEFRHPKSDRLTDEQWQKMLKSGKQPSLASWTKSFFTNSKKMPKLEFDVPSSGC